MTRGSLSRLLLAAPLALALHAAAASAGTSEVTPFIGAMIPANSLILESSGSIIRMQTQTLYGLDMGKMVGSRFGIAAVLAAGTGKMEVVGGSTALALATTTFIADLRGRFRLCGGADDANTGLVLGVGYTDVNSGLFDFAHETNAGTFLGRLTGIVGADVHAPVSDRFGLKVTAVDRIHVQGVSINGLGGPGVYEKTQNDICATAGLTFKLSH
jgi:hypothetical protein